MAKETLEMILRLNMVKTRQHLMVVEQHFLVNFGILAVVVLIQIHINVRFVTQNVSLQNDENFRSVKSKDVH